MRVVAIAIVSLACGCESVPPLDFAAGDGSVDGSAVGVDASADGASSDGSVDASADVADGDAANEAGACGVLPQNGTCCANGIVCVGMCNTMGCASCGQTPCNSGEICCAKMGGNNANCIKPTDKCQ